MRLSLGGGASGRRRREQAKSGHESASPRQRTLALSSLLPRGDGPRFHLLDLGAASPANLDFYARFDGKISFADFYHGLGRVRAQASSTGGELDLTSLFPRGGEERSDLILAWDLLNYLRPGELERFMDGLAPFCRPGTALHAFVYTMKDMPASPIRYRIEDEKTLVYEDVPGEGRGRGHRRPCPRYHEQELVKRLAGFAVESRFQLRNGIVEYVLSFRLSQRAAVEDDVSSRSTASPERSPWEPAPRWRPAPSR